MLIIPECQAAHIPRECAASIMRRAVLARKSWGSQKPSGFGAKMAETSARSAFMVQTARRIIDAAHAPGMYATWHSGIMSTTKDPRMTSPQVVKKVSDLPDPERVMRLFFFIISKKPNAPFRIWECAHFLDNLRRSHS